MTKNYGRIISGQYSKVVLQQPNLHVALCYLEEGLGPKF